MERITVPTTEQVAAHLQHAARIAAPVVALLITTLLLLVELTYELGYQLGSAVHARNDQLSKVWVRLWVGGTAEPAAPDPLQELGSGVHSTAEPAAPTAPLQHPLSVLANELEQLTATQLRAVLGTRRRCSKAQLIAAAMAW